MKLSFLINHLILILFFIYLRSPVTTSTSSLSTYINDVMCSNVKTPFINSIHDVLQICHNIHFLVSSVAIKLSKSSDKHASMFNYITSTFFFGWTALWKKKNKIEQPW